MTLTDTRVHDRYPTRTAEPRAPFGRAEPTVWGGLTGPIDPATLAAHDTHGYSRHEALLGPDEVAAFRAELDRLAGDDAVRADERTVVERATDEVRSIFEVHRISELVAELVRDPRVLGRARQVLGSEVYLHQSRVNYMPGFQGKGFYWHSDFETWHAEDGMPVPRAVSMSIALTDNFPFNGGLMVMPGSHRTFVPCVGETPAEHYKASLTEQEIGVPSQAAITRLAAEHGIDQFTGAAGSALMFDSNLMHGSGNNITPFPRSNIFLCFNSVANALVDPFAAPRPRPGFIASRTFAALSR
ncbi:ectoine hydroxylase [Actinokineospora diospyrosa]|uniref:Ectoine hydroxylase n=1 Tax=Actinokineospora diospyrosa TaxID=103728 RepID=A0ABT1IGY7_9PSEU|nr:ectoine hydroxylase [Actinokineospora diospyrosa]MCP2271905.1 ectoine hydroxylase [Actinokineospora diospyrosa]